MRSRAEAIEAIRMARLELDQAWVNRDQESLAEMLHPAGSSAQGFHSGGPERLDNHGRQVVVSGLVKQWRAKCQRSRSTTTSAGMPTWD